WCVGYFGPVHTECCVVGAGESRAASFPSPPRNRRHFAVVDRNYVLTSGLRATRHTHTRHRLPRNPCAIRLKPAPPYSTFNFARVPLMRISRAPLLRRITRRPSSWVAPRPV